MVALVLVACPGNGPAIPEWLDDEASGTGTTTVHAGTTTTGTDVDGATTTTTDVDETSVDTTGPGDASTDGTTTGKPTDCAGSGMSFSTLTSMDNDLVVNLDVAGLVSCNQNIIFVATGGTVCILDDGEGGYYYVMESIALEDVRPVSCGLANIGLVNLSINSISDGTEVTVPQAGGMMTGNQSIQVFGDLEGTALGMPVGPTPLMDFAGVLPEGDAMFGADDTTVTYADNVTQLATTMPEVAPGIMVTVTLSGLEGSLTFAL